MRIGTTRTALVIGMIAVAAVATGCSSSPKSKDSARTIRVADAYTPHQASYDGTVAFVGQIGSAKSGVVKAKHYPASQLGDETAILSSVRSGAIQAAALTSQTLSSVDPQFGVFSVPYLFPDTATLGKYWGSGAGKSVLSSLEKYGMHGLGFEISGFGDLISKQAVTSSAQIKGQTLRVLPSPIEQPAIKALGATPTSVGATQLYLALQQGTVDGVTSTSTFWLGTKLYEVAKHAVFLDYECICDAIVVNSAYWKTLSSDQQKTMEKAAQAAQALSLSKYQSYNTASKAELQKNGVTVTDQLSDIDTVKTTMRAQVWPQLSKLIGSGVLQSAVQETGAG
jgi:tripartite ATP-independent transporter DctP family solute receptor